MSIFYNSLGDFQWASIAAIIAGLGALVSLIFSLLGYLNSRKGLKYQIEIDQKKIDADIISKSRMHWIDNTKIIISRFLMNAIYLSAENVMYNEKVLQFNNNQVKAKELLKIKEDKTIKYKERKQASEELEHWLNEGIKYFNDDMSGRTDRMNNLIRQIQEDYTLIKLNFSNNNENNVIINITHEIYEELRVFSLNNGWNQFSNQHDLILAIKKAKDNRNSNSKKVDKLVELSRDYYKREWEKVKVGK